MWLLFVAHLSGCLWYFVARLNDFDFTTWVCRYGFQDESTTFLYVTSVYFGVTVITTVGFGDIVPYTIEEKYVVAADFYKLCRIFCVGLFLLGILSFSYFVSKIPDLLNVVTQTEPTKLSVVVHTAPTENTRALRHKHNKKMRSFCKPPTRFSIAINKNTQPRRLHSFIMKKHSLK